MSINFNSESYDSVTKKVILFFKSQEDLQDFKHNCNSPDLYSERDSRSLIGVFPKTHLDMAIRLYNAYCKIS